MTNVLMSRSFGINEAKLGSGHQEIGGEIVTLVVYIVDLYDSFLRI